MPRRRLAVLVLLVAVASVSCASPRNVLGTRESTCFRAYPVAKSEVQRGVFVGARPVEPSTAKKTLPALEAVPSGHACLVAFRGDFTSPDVRLAHNAPAGRYAVVVVTTSDYKAVAAVLLDELPRGFRRS